jgi:hypothetical protein
VENVSSRAGGGEESAEEKEEPRLKYTGPETLWAEEV